jgi:hypothetical protein
VAGRAVGAENPRTGKGQDFYTDASHRSDFTSLRSNYEIDSRLASRLRSVPCDVMVLWFAQIPKTVPLLPSYCSGSD